MTLREMMETKKFAAKHITVIEANSNDVLSTNYHYRQSGLLNECEIAEIEEDGENVTISIYTC